MSAYQDARAVLVAVGRAAAEPIVVGRARLTDTMLARAKRAAEKAIEKYDRTADSPHPIVANAADLSQIAAEGAAKAILGHPAIAPMAKALEAFIARHKHADLSPLVTSDFEKHDVGALRKNKAERPFVWMVGTTGTHLVWIDLHQKPPIRLLRDVASTWSDPAIYFWDGVALLPMTNVDRLASVLEDWHRA